MGTDAATSLVQRETRAGRFNRQPNHFTERITADGSSRLAAEAGRYHLYVSLACPWAHRAVIVRRLMGLETAISMSVADPIRDERGWRFAAPDDRDADHDADPIRGFRFLAEAYAASDPDYDGRVTVPAIWDRETGRIVTNDFPAITPMLATAFAHLATRDSDLYPRELREEIERVAAPIYHHVNNGVYKAGFATTQEAYEEAFDALFGHLDALEQRLGQGRFLLGDRLTDADIRLYTTLVRFDAVYYTHFKCNLRRLVDYPNLWGYARDLYQRPVFGETTDFDHIKRHYYGTHERLNPTRIVPKGPATDWDAPHDRG